MQQFAFIVDASRFRRVISWIPTMAVILSGVAHAEQATPTPPTDNPSDSLDAIVVTAELRQERLTSVPVSVESLSRDALKFSVYTTTTDIFKLTPSVTFTAGADPSDSSVTIRGISSVNFEGGGIQPSTAIVVDEVPMARQSEFINDFGDIDHIEVLRGPQGTLFGKNATAGVVNIVHNQPTSQYESSLTIGDTTDHERLGQAMVNIPLSDTVRFRVNGFWRDQDKLFDNIDPDALNQAAENPGGIDSYGLAGKLSIDFTSSIQLLISGDAYHQDSRAGALVVIAKDSNPALAAIQTAANVVAPFDHPFINSDSGAEALINGSGISANLTAHLSDSLTFHSVTAYRQVWTDFNNDADGGPWGGQEGVGLLPNPYGYPFNFINGTNGGLPRAPDDTHYISQELRMSYSGTNLDLTGGAFTQLFNEHKINSNPAIGDFLGTGQLLLNNDQLSALLRDNVYSAFADATYRFVNQVSVFGGLRFTDEKLRLNYSRSSWFTPDFNPVTLLGDPGTATTTAFVATLSKTNVSGRGGIRYMPDDNQMYYISYTTGYKGPATDISRESVPGHSFTAPELAQSFELGTKQEFFNQRFLTNVTLFHQLTKNLQQTALLPESIVTQLENTGDVLAYGVEVDSAAKLTKDLRLSAAASYVHANYDNFLNSCYPNQTVQQGCVNNAQNLGGTITQGAPRFSGNLGADYNISIPDPLPFNSYVHLGYAYTGEIQYGLEADPMLRQGAHGSLDATLGFTSKHDKWELQIYGKNLTNQHYYTDLYSADNYIGRVFAVVPRDFWRYGGIRLTAKF